jgi:hypothetical protein
MTHANITIVLLLMVGLGLVVWDVFVAFCNDTPNEEDTISGILLNAAKRFAALPFAFGVLMGHLFVDQSWLRIPQPWAAAVLVAMAAGLALGYNHRPSRYATWVCLLAGIPAGAAFWPQ